jgi:putative glycosyltransferase (TIGR04372 family)
MKYGIWRHENALGNSAEQTVCLSRVIQNTGDSAPKIYVETEFQKYFAMCIPGVRERDVFFFDKEKYDLEHLREKFSEYSELSDLIMPDVYFSFTKKTYQSTWSHLAGLDKFLRFPYDDYKYRYALSAPFILMQFREPRTYWKRFDGDNSEAYRNVNIQTFFDLAIHYANSGFIVVRIGDAKQTPMPAHPNIIDFAKWEKRTMFDDLFLLNCCQLFVSTDSGIWPMAAGLRKKMVLTNMVSCFRKQAIISWLNPTITSVLLKEEKEGRLVDNSFEQIKECIDRFL